MSRARLLTTSEGTRHGSFGLLEWALLLATAIVWGSSYLWIDVGLRSLPPLAITMLRLSLGALTLAVFPAARRPIDAEDRGRFIFVGLGWLALPMLAFPIAQQWVDSSIVGVLNAAVPLETAFFASLLLRRLPGPRQIVGLLVGFLGLAVLSWPSLEAADATALGVGLVLGSMTVNALLTSVLVPLQQRYGALTVVWRSQLVALTVVIPLGLVSLVGARPTALSLAAMIPLGALSTGLAFITWTSLLGRAGASRGSVVSYFVPIVAVALGVLVLNEELPPSAAGGAAAVIIGAVLVGGRDARAPRQPASPIDPAVGSH